MDSKVWFKVGDRVSGAYFGNAYSGSVIESRPHTIHPTRIETTVALDMPIEVFGNTRERIIVATADSKERNTIIPE